MKIGDLVWMPYWKGYGVILEHNPANDHDDENWRVAHLCGYISNEYKEDMEAASG